MPNTMGVTAKGTMEFNKRKKIETREIGRRPCHVGGEIWSTILISMQVTDEISWPDFEIVLSVQLHPGDRREPILLGDADHVCREVYEVLKVLAKRMPDAIIEIPGQVPGGLWPPEGFNRLQELFQKNGNSPFSSFV